MREKEGRMPLQGNRKTRFIVKCRIGVNATNCTSSMPNALKSNAKLNARVRARGIKKCYSYSVGCDAII